MNTALAGGLVTAMTVAALSISGVSGPTGGPPGGGVQASGSQVVIVSGGGTVVSSPDTAGGSTSMSAIVGPVGCPAPAGESADLLVTLRRWVCALPTLPADVTRHAFPPTLPWLGLMPF